MGGLTCNYSSKTARRYERCFSLWHGAVHWLVIQNAVDLSDLLRKLSHFRKVLEQVMKYIGPGNGRSVGASRQSIMMEISASLPPQVHLETLTDATFHESVGEIIGVHYGLAPS